jgi:undecaprenyl-diphosphatase
MPIWQAIILGAIQGLTEFLPISSSAHLTVVPRLFGWQDMGIEFDIALHFGTLLAVLGYFFKDWLQVVLQGFGLKSQGGDPTISQNKNLLWLLVIATIPAGVIGLLFEKKAEAAGDNMYLVGTLSIVMGLLMLYAERVATRKRDLGTVSMADAITIGAAQALAVMPGVSRSGITITTGLFRGLDRYAAARFSFLLSTPIIAGAAAKNFYDMFKHGMAADQTTVFAVGILVSAITGALTIRYFMDFLRTRSLAFFVSYRVIFGIMVIALAIFRS